MEDRCFVCSHCVIVGEHRGHECKSLKVAFNDGKENLQQQLKALELKRTDLTTMMVFRTAPCCFLNQYLQEGLEGIKSQVENVAGEMQKDIEGQVSHLDQMKFFLLVFFPFFEFFFWV